MSLVLCLIFKYILLKFHSHTTAVIAKHCWGSVVLRWWWYWWRWWRI